MDAFKEIQIKTLVTQTVERIYILKVPNEECQEDLKTLVEEGNVSDLFISSEEEEVFVSQKVTGISDLTALKANKAKIAADELEKEILAESKTEGAGRF